MATGVPSGKFPNGAEVMLAAGVFEFCMYFVLNAKMGFEQVKECPNLNLSFAIRQDPEVAVQQTPVESFAPA
jgi:hypothetical protein